MNKKKNVLAHQHNLKHEQLFELDFNQENFAILKQVISNNKTLEIELRERIREYQKKIHYYQEQGMYYMERLLKIEDEKYNKIINDEFQGRSPFLKVVRD